MPNFKCLLFGCGFREKIVFAMPFKQSMPFLSIGYGEVWACSYWLVIHIVIWCHSKNIQKRGMKWNFLDTCKNTDSDEDCGTWYKSGFCEKSSVWYGYMKANCQKSCSFCKVKGIILYHLFLLWDSYMIKFMHSFFTISIFGLVLTKSF